VHWSLILDLIGYSEAVKAHPGEVASHFGAIETCAGDIELT